MRIIYHLFFCLFFITVTVAATSGNFKGFLCEARTDPNTYSTVVGTMAAVAGSSVPSSEPCGTVKLIRIYGSPIGITRLAEW